MKNLILLLLAVVLFCSCSPTRAIRTYAKKDLLQVEHLKGAHIGIVLFEPATGKWWYNHQGEKYFTPASNVKIFTNYMAMKYLGDSIKGIVYSETQNNVAIIEGTGDPTLLHPDFPNQPVLNFLKKKQHILINTQNWADEALGRGWSWDDYNDAYMTERSAMPVYGNTIRISKLQQPGDDKLPFAVFPRLFNDSVQLSDDVSALGENFSVRRDRLSNKLLVVPSADPFSTSRIPFSTSGFELTRKLLRDTLKSGVRASYYTLPSPQVLYSQATDSVLKPMMHNSDNFFAEQLLLMVSNELLKTMNAEKLIEKLLTSDLQNLPQKPRWVDGSGLSRYNLFTPESVVAILEQMRAFGMERLKAIFPTAGEGTLSSFDKGLAGSIYAKTGSMSGVVCLSGYLRTSKKKDFIFSVMVNNHQAAASDVKNSIEQFLSRVSTRN